MAARHIHIEGIVQGVGFRPHVFLLAKKLGLKGWVNNSSDGVHIEVQGEEECLLQFTEQLTGSPPGNARITHWSEEEIPDSPEHEFRIIQSDPRTQKSVLLTPDQALCENCEKELHDPGNRRYRYPFITCTHCGPRFSIISALPYDREHTTMDPFTMCDSCDSEYFDITDRRYFSQTNSCDDCGIDLTWDAEPMSTREVLIRAITALKKGEILAVKGIGGYLLMCDATNAQVIRQLRTRKKRPSKPFAVLYPDIALAAGDTEISEAEKAALESVEAPIVILNTRKTPASGICMDEIAPGLSTLGVMRPYAPLLSLLAQDFGKPLIATSGNYSGSPILFTDESATKGLCNIADHFVGHNREILMPEDDSVIRFSGNQPIILRRSRGLAPNIFEHSPLADEQVLSLGASMKGTFFLRHGRNSYLSQYLGDQENYESQLSYEAVLSHMVKVLDFEPRILLTDMHPWYSTRSLGLEIAREKNIPCWKVQHHEAHFSAVMAENGLLDSAEPVLGVVWDGTGYGHDGAVWGGEFFIYSHRTITRKNHLRYYSHILGDKMPREPRLSALSILFNSGHKNVLRKKFETMEWDFYQKLLQREDRLFTSSIGRLFDAAACLLNLGDKISYEGEAALMLEDLASKSKGKPRDFKVDDVLDPQHHLDHLINGIREGRSAEDIAFDFHYGLVLAIKRVAQDNRVYKIAFSGGVFQNALLVKLCKEELEPSCELYFHRDMSPNDENIAYGQWIHHGLYNTQKKLETELSNPINHLTSEPINP